MAQKRIEEKLEATEQEIMSLKSRVKTLLGIEEGVVTLLKSISASSVEVVMIKNYAGNLEVVSGSSSKESKEKEDHEGDKVEKSARVETGEEVSIEASSKRLKCRFFEGMTWTSGSFKPRGISISTNYLIKKK